MPSCSAHGCTNRPSTKSKQQRTLEASGLKITFHRIPKNAALKKLWVEAIRRKDWMPSDNSVLCSMHFTEADFDKTSLSVVRLRENAVPSVFKVLQVSKYESKRKSAPKEKQEVAPAASTSRVSPVAETNQTDYSLTAVESELPDYNSLILKTVTRSTSVSPESKRRFELSTKQLMQNSFKIRQQKYIKKIKTLQRTKIRQKKTISDLKKVLLELNFNDFLCEDSYEIMNNIP